MIKMIGGIILMIWIITGCATPTPAPTQASTTAHTPASTLDATPKQDSKKTPTIEVIVIVIGIVRKGTQEPMKDATLTFTWEEENGDKQSEVQEKEFPITGYVLADGKAMLWVKAEAPGYHRFNIGIRAKADKNKVLEFPIEMERIEINNREKIIAKRWG